MWLYRRAMGDVEAAMFDPQNGVSIRATEWGDTPVVAIAYRTEDSQGSRLAVLATFDDLAGAQERLEQLAKRAGAWVVAEDGAPDL